MRLNCTCFTQPSNLESENQSTYTTEPMENEDCFKEQLNDIFRYIVFNTNELPCKLQEKKEAQMVPYKKLLDVVNQFESERDARGC